MKLKDTFVTQEMDGEQVMVEADGGFAGMVRSNATAAFIIDQLKTETTKEAILDAMRPDNLLRIYQSDQVGTAPLSTRWYATAYNLERVAGWKREKMRSLPPSPGRTS